MDAQDFTSWGIDYLKWVLLHGKAHLRQHCRTP